MKTERGGSIGELAVRNAQATGVKSGITKEVLAEQLIAQANLQTDTPLEGVTFDDGYSVNYEGLKYGSQFIPKKSFQNVELLKQALADQALVAVGSRGEELLIAVDVRHPSVIARLETTPVDDFGLPKLTRPVYQNGVQETGYVEKFIANARETIMGVLTDGFKVPPNDWWSKVQLYDDVTPAQINNQKAVLLPLRKSFKLDEKGLALLLHYMDESGLRAVGMLPGDVMQPPQLVVVQVHGSSQKFRESRFFAEPEPAKVRHYNR